MENFSFLKAYTLVGLFLKYMYPQQKIQVFLGCYKDEVKKLLKNFYFKLESL